jgi:hypothetical protein
LSLSHSDDEGLHSTRRLKHMSVVTLRIPIFNSLTKLTKWFLLLYHRFYVMLETSILHKRKLKVSCFCQAFYVRVGLIAHAGAMFLFIRG